MQPSNQQLTVNKSTLNQSTIQPSNQRINQSINQSIHQSINQPISQPIKQYIKQSNKINQPTELNQIIRTRIRRTGSSNYLPWRPNATAATTIIATKNPTQTQCSGHVKCPFRRERTLTVQLGSRHSEEGKGPSRPGINIYTCVQQSFFWHV